MPAAQSRRPRYRRPVVEGRPTVPVEVQQQVAAELHMTVKTVENVFRGRTKLVGRDRADAVIEALAKAGHPVETVVAAQWSEVRRRISMDELRKKGRLTPNQAEKLLASQFSQLSPAVAQRGLAVLDERFDARYPRLKKAFDADQHRRAELHAGRSVAELSRIIPEATRFTSTQVINTMSLRGGKVSFRTALGVLWEVQKYAPNRVIGMRRKWFDLKQPEDLVVLSTAVARAAGITEQGAVRLFLGDLHPFQAGAIIDSLAARIDRPELVKAMYAYWWNHPNTEAVFADLSQAFRDLPENLKDTPPMRVGHWAVLGGNGFSLPGQLSDVGTLSQQSMVGREMTREFRNFALAVIEGRPYAIPPSLLNGSIAANRVFGALAATGDLSPQAAEGVRWAWGQMSRLYMERRAATTTSPALDELFQEFMNL